MNAAIQKLKSSIATGLFVALLISAAPVVAHAGCEKAAQEVVKTVASTDNKAPKSFYDNINWTNAALFAFFLAQVRLWTREGDTSPVRYNIDELANGENICNNLYYLVDDGFIGHFGKKPYLTVDTDNQRIEVQLADAEDANGKPIKDAQGNKVKVSTACYPKGLLGWGSFYLKPILCAFGSAVAIKLLVETLNEANAAGEPFAKRFLAKFNAFTGALPSKWSDVGTVPALNALGTVAGK